MKEKRRHGRGERKGWKGDEDEKEAGFKYKMINERRRLERKRRLR